MALQKQKFLVNLGQGVDTKTDSKHVMPGKCSVLENAVFTKGQRIDKRAGYSSFATKLTDGSSLPIGDSLGIFNEELLLYGNQNLYSYSTGAKGWVEKGSAVSATVRTEQIIKNTYAQTQSDSAYNLGIELYAWVDSRGGIRASVLDEQNGTSLLTDVAISASGSRVRCVAFSNYLYVFFYRSGSLYLRRINPLSPTAFDAEVEVSSTVLTANPNYDVLAYYNQRMLVCHSVQGSAQIKCIWLNTEGGQLTGVLIPFNISGTATNCLSVVLGPSNTLYFLYHNGTNGLRCAIYNNGGTLLHASFTVDATTSPTVVNVTGYATPLGITVFYELTGSTADVQYTKTNTVAKAGTAGSSALFLRSVGLASKAFRYTNLDGETYGFVGITHQSSLQSTFFVARSDGLIIAKQQYTSGGGLLTGPVLPNVWSVSGTAFKYSILNKTQLFSEAGTVYSPNGVASTSVDFTNERNFTSAQLGSNLHIIGGVLSMYDGQSIVEHGYHLYPERMSSALSGSTGVADGLYNYVAVYEWTDNYGQIHRSAPSVPLAVTVSGGPKIVTVDVDTLRLTSKTGTRTPVSIVLYRTEAGPGDIYYRASSITSPTYNDLTVDSVSVADSTTDAQLISREILYSVGGVLENFAAPACASITVYKNRIFLGGLESSNEIWFSKEHKSGDPVEFNDTLKNNIEPTGGEIKTPEVLDDKIIFFKGDRWYFSYGDGPNNTGLLGSFTEPQFVSSDVGCANPNSVVRVPGGVFLKTAKGIYFIDSTLNSSYIGADVEDFNGLEITSAILVADENQIRFTTRDGVGLVYDYYFKQWSTFTSYAANDGILWQGQYVILRTNGSIMYEDQTVFKDNGSPYGLKLVTGWLALDTVAGWQRIYKIMVVGSYKTPHILKVSFSYDYSPGYSETKYIYPEDVLQARVYGEDSPYGNSETYGGIPLNYSFIVSPKRQKCQAIRFMIEEITTAATAGSGEGFTISDIAMVVGIKGDLAKLRQAQQF